MQWIEKWTTDLGVKGLWVIEGDLVSASITLTDQGFDCWHPTGQMHFPADTAPVFVLTAVEDAIHAALKEALDKMNQKPLSVVVESSPVELIQDSEDVLGYGSGWLRVKEDREVPKHWLDAVKLDDGRTAHIHPFVPLNKVHHADLFKNVKVGQYVAGVRWFS